jgi:hypothetical protein
LCDTKLFFIAILFSFNANIPEAGTKFTASRFEPATATSKDEADIIFTRYSTAPLATIYIDNPSIGPFVYIRL